MDPAVDPAEEARREEAERREEEKREARLEARKPSDRAYYRRKVAAKKAKKAEIVAAQKAETAKRARQALGEGQAAALDRESFVAAG